MGTLAPVAVMLVTVPLLINALGEARFGVLSLVWVLTGYVLFFDFGVGQAINYELAKLKKAAPHDRAALFWLALCLVLAFAVVGAPLLYGLAYLAFAHFIDMPEAVRAEALAVMPWIALSLPLSIFNGFFVGTLAGCDRFGLLNTSRAIGQVVVSCAQVFAALFIGATLDIVIPAAMIGTGLSVALLGVFAFRSVPAGWRPRPAGMADAKRVLGYGGWVSVGSFARQVIVNSDRFFIGWLTGAQAVGLYSVVINLARRLNTVPLSLVEALFPAVASRDGAAQRDLMQKGIRIQAALCLMVAGGMAIAVEPFLWLWIGADFAGRAAPVAQLVAVSTFIVGMNGLAIALVRATGDPRFTALVLISQIPPFFIGLYFGSVWYGVIGVAAVNILRALFDMGRLFRRLDMLGQVAKLSAPIILALLSALLLPLFTQTPWSPLGMGVRIIAAFMVALWGLWLAPELLALVPSRFRVWERTKPQGDAR